MTAQNNKFTFLKITLFSLAILILASCGSNKDSKEMIFKSNDGKTSVFINGTKPSFGDPWHAKIKIKTPKDEQEVVTEIYAGELNNESVQVNWQGNDKCKLVFLQQDDTKRTMVIEADSNHIKLHEE